MTKYTFTFDPADENKFNEVLSRLEPDQYTILEETRLVNPEKPRESDKQTIIEMEPEAALTFRLGMKFLKIRRERTEEELAEEKRVDDMNTVRITVQVPMGDSGTTP